MTSTSETIGSNEAQFKVACGNPLFPGATVLPQGVNFSVFSFNAESCTLVLFKPGDNGPFAEIPFPDNCRVGAMFSMVVEGLNLGEFEYGYRLNGPNQPEAGFRFDASKVVLDPYSKAITGRGVWKQKAENAGIFPNRGRIG